MSVASHVSDCAFQRLRSLKIAHESRPEGPTPAKGGFPYPARTCRETRTYAQSRP